MIMTEKQMHKRLEKCWDLNYSQYTNEAEWHGNPENNIWICDIPSIMKGVRLTLDLDTKDVYIEEREIIEYGALRCKYGEWNEV